MSPKDSLREEHGVMMKMLAVLQQFFEKRKAPIEFQDGEAEDLETLIEFFEIYVDRNHHGKEEQHIFPALSRDGTPDIDFLIDSLIADHCRARKDIQKIKSLVLAIHTCPGDESNDFSMVAQNYVELVRKHIRKENSELLPLIEERLSETERLHIGKQFLELEKSIPGVGGVQTFMVSAGKLYQKYRLHL